jgi:hypothetical protein
MDWLNFFRIFGYGALIVGAVCTVGVDFIKNKEDRKKETVQESKMTELSTDVKASRKLLEPFSDLAIKLYPNVEQKEALEKLRNRLDSTEKEILENKAKVTGLTTELNTEKKTIKSFDAIVSIVISGKWNGTPYPLWYQNVKPTTYMRWHDNSGKLPDLEFATSKLLSETVDKTTAQFKNTFSISPGQFPLGELTEILKSYDKMECWVLITEPSSLLSPIITFNRIDIIISINGSKRGEFHNTNSISQDYSETLKKLTPGKTEFITPTVELNGKLIDLFKINL